MLINLPITPVELVLAFTAVREKFETYQGISENPDPALDKESLRNVQYDMVNMYSTLNRMAEALKQNPQDSNPLIPPDDWDAAQALRNMITTLYTK